ncbi:SRPBCC family protein [Nocardia sp. NPDC050175]|uniref:SRPBCC family protein n=1 Tax=Nocardia sp. NPDC050175 TaxID=3364317 RepID=UPI00378D6623
MSENGEITIHQIIAAPVEDVWDALQVQSWLVREVDDIRDMRELNVDRSPGGEIAERLVSWQVWLKGFELGWQEQQQLDPRAHRIDFRQTEGMFAVYTGSCGVRAHADGSVVELHLNIETGIPYLAGIVDPVLAAAFSDLAQECLHSLGKSVVASAQ